MPQQRDSNADSGPTPRRPSPGARGAEALRQAQQFDVFRRDPVVPQQASPADGNDFDEAADRTPLPRDERDPRDLRDPRNDRDPRGQVDISVFDASPEPPQERPGFDLRAPLRGPASYDQPTDIIPAILDDPAQDSFGRHPGAQNTDGHAFGDEAAAGFGTQQGFPPGPQGFATPQPEEQAFGEQGFGEQGFGEQGFSDQGFSDQGFSDQGFPAGNASGFGAQQGFPPAGDEAGFSRQQFGAQGAEAGFGAQQGFPAAGDEPGFGNQQQFSAQQGFPPAGDEAGFGRQQFGAQGAELGFGGRQQFGAEGAEAGFGAPQGFPPAGGFGADDAVFDNQQGFPPGQGFGAEAGDAMSQGFQPAGESDFDARQGFSPSAPQGFGAENADFSFTSRQGFPAAGQGFPPAEEQGFPEQGFPEQGFPEQGFAEQGFPPAQDAHSAGIDPASTFGGQQAFAPQAGNDPSFGARPVEEMPFGAAEQAAAAPPVFGAPEGGMPSFGDRPLTPNTSPDYGLGAGAVAEPQAEPPLGAHLDPPRFEPAPPVFDDPAEGVEFGGAGEEPGPVFATPTVAIPPADGAEYVEGAALDEDADGDAEPEMLVPWAATAGSENAEALEADGLQQGPDDVYDADPYDTDLFDADGEPYDDTPRVPPYDDDALAAVHRVIHERRDVRNDFLPDPIPDEVLTRVLEAAHTAPSVGLLAALGLPGHPRARRPASACTNWPCASATPTPRRCPRPAHARSPTLKIEAILDTPVNIVVTCDPTRGGRHTLGRHTQPQMAPYSSALAVENLWLAARAEGLGVGWVSFFDERELAAVLDLPDHLSVVAYLCVGYVK